LFLQGNVLGGFTGLVDDGDAHLCGFFFGFFLLGTGGENDQRRYEDQNQCNQLFISVSSFQFLSLSIFLLPFPWLLSGSHMSIQEQFYGWQKLSCFFVLLAYCSAGTSIISSDGSSNNVLTIHFPALLKSIQMK
jgi:hypothetical protein